MASSDPSPFMASYAVVKIEAKELTAKDQWLTEEASSDPWIKFLSSSSVGQADSAVSEDNADFTGEDMVELFRTEVVEKCLNPAFQPVVRPLGALDAGAGGVVAAVMDYDWTSGSDLIGVAKDIDLLSSNETTYQLTKRGKPAGKLTITVDLAWGGHRGDHHSIG